MPSEADRLVRLLDLKPHPEGGYFRETFRDCGQTPAGRDCGQPPPAPAGSGANAGRANSTAIYFLLKAGEVSRWHRVDAAEVWHFYRGAALELRIGKQTYILGADIDEAQVPQIVVPAGAWQAARTLGAYTLVGCTVSPGFEFEHFELAPDGFEP
jgi:predicted cupin superfamily sugar epimerase